MWSGPQFITVGLTSEQKLEKGKAMEWNCPVQGGNKDSEKKL